MKVEYLKGTLKSRGKLLCITHTERPTNLLQCDLNYLELRYSKTNRLPPKEKFCQLKSSKFYSPYSGSVTIWRFVESNFSNPILVAHLSFNDERGFKPQFAIWYNRKLWILGCESILVYSDDLSLLNTITHPWLSGAHTLVPDNNRNLYVSCAASDSVIIIDENTNKIIQVVRVPEKIYGFNYALEENQSVVEHYIHNDIQLTHVNCAWPWKNGFLISTLIPGAIGYFNKNRKYLELTSGFVGVHGVRIETVKGKIYFCDSCAGFLVFLSDTYQIAKRIDCYSRWLHDAQQLEGNHFALSVSDKNHIEIIDVLSRKRLTIMPCADFGNGTQFVYYGE